jgi:hypothetical protein
VSEYGFVRGENNMMREIKARGPISCRQAVTKEFLKYNGKGIFKDKTGDTHPRHATSLLGWGVAKDGTKYWGARNSGGTYWGENGFFKIARGVNNLGIEEECSWGVPKENWKKEEGFLGKTDRLVRTQDMVATDLVDTGTASTDRKDIEEKKHEETESEEQSHDDTESEGSEQDLGESTHDDTYPDAEILNEDDIKPEEHGEPSTDDNLATDVDDTASFSGDELGNADADPTFISSNKARGVDM